MANLVSEREMIPYCRDVGVGLIPWSPIARGALSRSWGDRSTTREKSDRMLNAMIRGKENEIDKQVITRVEEIAKKHGMYNLPECTPEDTWKNRGSELQMPAIF